MEKLQIRFFMQKSVFRCIILCNYTDTTFAQVSYASNYKSYLTSDTFVFDAITKKNQPSGGANPNTQ